MLYMPLFINMVTYNVPPSKCPYVKHKNKKESICDIFYLVLFFLDYCTIMYVYIAYLLKMVHPSELGRILQILYFYFFVVCKYYLEALEI